IDQSIANLVYRCEDAATVRFHDLQDVWGRAHVCASADDRLVHETASFHARYIKTVQSASSWLPLPARCSLHRWRTTSELKTPSSRSARSESRSPAQPRSGPRIHSPIGTANPIFGRSN